MAQVTSVQKLSWTVREYVKDYDNFVTELTEKANNVKQFIDPNDPIAKNRDIKDRDIVIAVLNELDVLDERKKHTPVRYTETPITLYVGPDDYYVINYVAGFFRLENV